MIYVVTGADTKTGAERTIQVSASDEQHAVAVAKEQGVYPYNVVRNEKAEKREAQRIQNEHAERERRQLAEQRAERVAERITQVKELMRARLQAGKNVFLYDSVYLPVDSTLLDETFSQGFDLSEIRGLGVSGWEVVQAIPKTIGVGLKNTSFGSTMGETWGGGSGGNIAGVHLVLKKPVKLDEITDDMDDEIADYIRSHFCGNLT